MLGSAAALALLFWVVPFRDIAARIGDLPAGWWPAAIAAYLALHLIGVAKWRLLVNRAGAGLPARAAHRAYYLGLFGNTFLPSLVGGDVVRAGAALSAVGSRSALVLGSLVDRMLDVVGLVALAGCGALLSPHALQGESRWILGALGGLLAAGGAATWFVVSRVPLRRFPFGVRRKLVPVRHALRAIRAPHALVGAFLLGLILQSLLTVLNWLLGRALGIEAPFYVWLFVWPLAKLAALVPITQNGFGVREAAQAALFSPFGVPATAAVAAGLIFDVVILCGGLIGGLLAPILGRGADERELRPAAVATERSRGAGAPR